MGPVLGAMLVLAAIPLQAAPIAWNVGDGEWSTAANWTPANVPVAADVVTFNAVGVNGNQIVYLNGNPAATSLIFDNTGTTTLLGGTLATPAANVLTLSAGITVNAGAGAVTLGSAGVPQVSVALNGNQTFANNSANLLTIHNGIAPSSATNRALTISGTGDTLLAGILANNGAGVLTLTKTGTGTLTLSGANIYTGATAVNGGTLNLDYSTHDDSKIAGVLTLSNGSVVLSGGTHAEEVTSTTIAAGSSSVSRSSGSAVLAMNAITRNIGGAINFGAANIATTDTAGTNGILGGWATVGGADWAVGGTADTLITALASYTALASATATSNNLLTGTGTTGGALSTYTLKLDTSGAGESLGLGGALTLTGGGLLFVGADDYEINGSTIAGSATAGRGGLTLHNYGTGSLTINSVVQDNGTANGGNTVVIAGPGTVIFTGANTYTGATYVTQGTLKAGADNVFGTGAGTALILSNTGTVDLDGFDQTVGTLSNTTSGTGVIELGSATLTFGNTTTTATFAGTISGTGGITKVGTGVQTLAGENTYTGVTRIDEGVLAVTSLSDANVAGALGASSADASNLVFNGGTLRYTGTTNTSTDRNFTIAAPTATLEAGVSGTSMRFTGGSDIVFSNSGQHTLVLTGNSSGTLGRNPGSYDLMYEVALNLGDSGVGPGNETSVSKTGTGIWALGGDNTYSGGTTISAGRLVGKSVTAFGTGDVTVSSGATVLLSVENGVYLNNISIAGTGGPTDSSSTVGGTSALQLNNGANLAGILTLADANATVSAYNANVGSTGTGVISGKITGAFAFRVGTTSTGGGGTITISNSANDYTGDTIVTSSAANSGSGVVLILGGHNAVANGVGKGNLVLNATGTSTGAYFSLNGFNETINGLGSSGTGTASGSRVVRNNAATASTLTLGDADATASFHGNIVNGSTGTLAITKIGGGTQTLLGVNSYTGATIVNGGTLLISDGGTLTGTSGVTVNNGGTFAYAATGGLNRAVMANAGGTFRYNSTAAYTGALTNAGGSVAGSGNLGATILQGTGTVDPGNSPGILTAAATNGSAGLGYNFEFTTANAAPTWSDASASGNDVLRLTAAVAPFVTSLDEDNAISIYLNLASISLGDVFEGGFFTDKNEDFLTSIESAVYAYYVYGNGGGSHAYNGFNYYTLAEYNSQLIFEVGVVQVAAADFAGATINNGWVSQFTVAAIPEPSAAWLLGLGGAVLWLRRLRRS